jgi:hypothetical protein
MTSVPNHGSRERVIEFMLKQGRPMSSYGILSLVTWRRVLGCCAVAVGTTQVVASASVAAPPHFGIRIDGDFADWQRHAEWTLPDPADDGQVGSIDLLAVGAMIDSQGLALYLRASEPFVIAQSAIQIRLDTDGDPATGSMFQGLGVDVTLDFAPSQVDTRFFPAQAIYPDGLVLPAAEFLNDLLPNGLNDVTAHSPSREYEMLVPLAALPNLQPGGRIGILVRDAVSFRGDMVPDLGARFHIDVPPHVVPPADVASLDRAHPTDVRVAVWNTFVDGVQDPAKEPAFGRILQTLQPDIVNFQELWNTQAPWIKQFMDKWLPLPPPGWHVHWFGDCATASRFPIRGAWNVEPRSIVVWLDTAAALGVDTVIVNAHTTAYDQNQALRLAETDALLAQVRALRRGEVPDGPPDPHFALLFVGDLNANAPKPELSAARTGRFALPHNQHLNFWPDPFGQPLADAAPRQTHRRRIATFRALTSGNFQRLDYLYFTDSLLSKQRAFVFDSAILPFAWLEPLGVLALDSRVSDHLLLVADFAQRPLHAAWHAGTHALDSAFVSRWFGPVDLLPGSGFIRSPRHGILWSVPSFNGLWMWDPGMGWWFTYPASYPWVFAPAYDRWLAFASDPDGTRLIFDPLNNRWLVVP